MTLNELNAALAKLPADSGELRVLLYGENGSLHEVLVPLISYYDENGNRAVLLMADQHRYSSPE